MKYYLGAIFKGGLLVIIFFGQFTLLNAQKADWSFLQVPDHVYNIFNSKNVHYNQNTYYYGFYINNISIANSNISTTDSQSIFLIRYNHIDSLDFLKKIPIQGQLIDGINLIVDSFENYYVAVLFQNSIVVNNTTYTSLGAYDIILCKFDSLLNTVWVKQIGSIGQEGLHNTGYSLTFDQEQNLLFNFSVNSTIFIDTFYLNCTNYDAVLVHILKNGQVDYVSKGGSTAGWDNGIDVGIDNKNNSYLLGRYEYENGLYFDTTSANIGNLYRHFYCISKYNKDGQFLWFNHFGVQGNLSGINAMKIQTDSKANVYVAGTFDLDGNGSKFKINGGGEFTASLNSSNAFIIKYDSNGVFKWVKMTNHSDNEYFRGFTVSSLDELYLAYTITTGTILDTFTVSSHGGQDVVVTKLDTNGNIQWVEPIGGSGFDEIVNILAVDSSLYLLGLSISSPCDFLGTDHYTPSPGNLFLAKMNNYKKWPLSVSNTTAASESIQLIPNPSQGQFSVTLPSLGATRLSITSLTGQELFVQTLNPLENTHHIHVPSLATGVYVVQIYSESQRWVSKLLIE